MKYLLALMVLTLGLSGCNYLSTQPEQYGGIVHFSIDYDETGRLEEITVYDGKERGGVSIDIDNAETGATISVGGQQVSAFDGQAIRAELEKVLAENRISLPAEIINSLVGAIAQTAP